MRLLYLSVRVVHSPVDGESAKVHVLRGQLIGSASVGQVVLTQLVAVACSRALALVEVGRTMGRRHLSFARPRSKLEIGKRRQLAEREMKLVHAHSVFLHKVCTRTHAPLEACCGLFFFLFFNQVH